MSTRPVPNRELLLKVRERILAEPAQFQMESLFKGQARFDDQPEESKFWTPIDVKRVVPNCGTAACIAGWAAALTWGENPDRAHRTYEETQYFSPTRLLGLIRDFIDEDGEADLDSSRFDSLCYVWGWTEEKRKAWYATKDLQQRARIAAEVIDLRLAQWAEEDKEEEKA